MQPTRDGRKTGAAARWPCKLQGPGRRLESKHPFQRQYLHESRPFRHYYFHESTPPESPSMNLFPAGTSACTLVCILAYTPACTSAHNSWHAPNQHPCCSISYGTDRNTRMRVSHRKQVSSSWNLQIYQQIRSWQPIRFDPSTELILKD